MAKLLANSKRPEAPNLFLAFEIGEMRDSLGSSLLGATTNPLWARIESSTATAGRANQGETDPATAASSPPTGALAGPSKNSAASRSGWSSSTIIVVPNFSSEPSPSTSAASSSPP